MKISAMNHPARNPLKEIDWIGRHGFDFVDFTLEPPAADSDQIDPKAIRAALDRHALVEREPRGRRHTRTRWYRGRLGQFASVQEKIDLGLAGVGYLVAWLPPMATVGQAQTTLRRLSLNRLRLILWDRLVQEHNLGATQDIDIQGVYDDIALELDSYQEGFGDTQPFGTL